MRNEPFPDRRRFLKHALGGVASLSLGARAFGQRAIGSTALGDNIFLLTGAGANIVARTAMDGAVLVDGGLAENATAVAKAVAALPGSGPIRTLFNTHWHPEQTGLNLNLGTAGATIIAQENTRLWLSSDITRPANMDAGSETHKPLPKAALPNKTFYDKGSIAVGGEAIQYGYLLQAHTDGDIYVFFPQSNVLAIGGVTSANAWPFVDWWTGGWINGIVSGLDTLLKVANEQTKIVPAEGPVMTRTELEAQHKMYAAIAQRLRTMLFGGKSLSDAIAADPTKEFNGQMGDPKQFVKLSFQSMWGHFSPDA